MNFYADEKHMAIIPVPNCTCTPSFSCSYFVVSEQLCGEK